MSVDVYSLVTSRIVSLLEHGTVPWQKPWNVDSAPKNLITQKSYKGINVFLLNSLCFESPYFLTFKQAKDLGGFVRKGEKSAPVVYWNWLEVEDRENPQKLKKIPFLRYYSVFNLSQCDGIPASKIPVTDLEREFNPIEAGEQIVINMPNPPQIQEGGSRACYRPSLDRVDIPRRETFRSGEEYYSTLLHELTHATGHASRLNRKGVAGSAGEWSAFGSTPYAKEELVAEMGAAFLCGAAGIVERTVENSAAYIQSWLQRLKDDKRLVVQAAAQAQRASDYVLGKTPQHETE